VSRLVPDTLAGRTIVILVIGLGLFHLWSIWIYRIGSENLLGSGREPELADRIVSLALALNELPPEDREEGAHALSAPDLSVHWSPESLIGDEAANDERAALLRRRLAQIAPNLKVDALRFGFTGDAARHARMLLASVRLPDGSWVTFSPDPFSQTSAAEHDVLGSLTAMALGILVVSVLLVRSITAPLRTLADAADRIGTGIDAHQAPETGPREIRRVARAFNEMQARIRRLVSDRTQTLAAVSHDLKTPLTRLRLRSEFVEDRALRRMIDADLEEMEHMLDSALAFLRDDVTGEEGKMVDIGSILETICDEAADAGRDVVRVGPDHATLLCRPLAVKRAFSNLIDNAVKYGARAGVARGRPGAHPRHDRGRRTGHSGGRARAGLRPFLPAGGQSQPRDRRHRPGPDGRADGGPRPRRRDRSA
jgi:signal transduction histidine kinase